MKGMSVGLYLGVCGTVMTGVVSVNMKQLHYVHEGPISSKKGGCKPSIWYQVKGLKGCSRCGYRVLKTIMAAMDGALWS